MSTSSRSSIAVEHLRESKRKLRDYTRNLSPTEKIRQLELLQQRYYGLLLARERNGGRPIPENWRRWKEAQKTK